jgi:hypothetical protein
MVFPSFLDPEAWWIARCGTEGLVMGSSGGEKDLRTLTAIRSWVRISEALRYLRRFLQFLDACVMVTLRWSELKPEGHPSVNLVSDGLHQSNADISSCSFVRQRWRSCKAVPWLSVGTSTLSD